MPTFSVASCTDAILPDSISRFASTPLRGLPELLFLSAHNTDLFLSCDSILSLEIHLLCLLHADTCPHEEDNNIKRLHTQPLFYHVGTFFYYAVKIFYCLHHVLRRCCSYVPYSCRCLLLSSLLYDGVSQQCSQAHRCVSLYSLFRTHERHIYICHSLIYKIVQAPGIQ